MRNIEVVGVHHGLEAAGETRRARHGLAQGNVLDHAAADAVLLVTKHAIGHPLAIGHATLGKTETKRQRVVKISCQGRVVLDGYLVEVVDDITHYRTTKQHFVIDACHDLDARRVAVGLLIAQPLQGMCHQVFVAQKTEQFPDHLIDRLALSPSEHILQCRYGAARDRRQRRHAVEQRATIVEMNRIQ